jgi:hypothetical protein
MGSRAWIDRRNEVIAAWEAGFLTDRQVADWAERLLLAIEDAAAIPPWLLDLVERGAAACIELPGWYPEPLSYLDQFAVRASRLQLEITADVEEFARWASRYAISEDLALPEVHFGYVLDHLLDDCRRMDLAVEHVRKELPPMLEACRVRAMRVLSLAV